MADREYRMEETLASAYQPHFFNHCWLTGNLKQEVFTEHYVPIVFRIQSNTEKILPYMYLKTRLISL